MSGYDQEREDRAFDALIVSHLLRERNVTDLSDLPQLSEPQRAAMSEVSSDIVDRLWDEADAGECEEPLSEMEFEAMQEDWEFVGANRAEEMDEATKKKLEDARNAVRELMRQQNRKGRDNGES